MGVSHSSLPQPTGFPLADSILNYLTTPQFIIPQLLNLCGSVLFAVILGWGGELSVAVPLANGVSLAANALVDHFFGEGVPLWPGLPGITLIVTGVALCTGNSVTDGAR